MKKFIPLILAAALCLPFAALAEDAVSSASVADFYGQAALTGDDLMNAINSFSGFYLVTTTNPDNSPNAAFFVFGMVKHEDHYYVQLSLAENQSRSNLLANGEGVAVYAATPSRRAQSRSPRPARASASRRSPMKPSPPRWPRTPTKRRCSSRSSMFVRWANP